jgi:hypothetical protein
VTTGCSPQKESRLSESNIESRLPVSVACKEAKKGALGPTKEGAEPLERVKEQKVTSQA